MPSETTTPNWLFRGLVIISLLVHVVVFMRITELYRPRSLTYIELTMRSPSKPFAREIPRPRFRSKEPLRPEKVNRIDARPKTLPSHQPLPEVPRIDKAPDASRESIDIPALPSVKGVKVTESPAMPNGQPARALGLRMQLFLHMVIATLCRCAANRPAGGVRVASAGG